MRAHPILGLLVGLPILLVVLYALGGLTELGGTGLPTVPLATLLALPLDLWVRDLATALTVGAALVLLVAPRPSAVVRRLAIGSAAVWLAALGAQLMLTVSEVFALTWPRLTEQSVLSELVSNLIARTDLGRVIAAQSVIVAIAVVLLAVGRSRGSHVGAVALTVVAAWLPGLTGHAGMEHGHVAATIALGLHVVAASAWVGGLVAVAVYAGSGGGDPAVVLRRFGAIALVSVLVIAETGLLNASLRLDGAASLVTSPYGAILLAKTAILIVLIGWGVRHRRAVATHWVAAAPAAGSPAFLRWVSWEVLWMGAVYGLSIALSRTAPPGPALAGDRMNVGAMILLLLAIPMAVLFTAPALAHGFATARRYPESVAVASVVAIVVVAGWQASAISAGTMGVQVAAALGIVLLVGCGLVLAPAVASSPVAVVVVMIGLPVATWWLERGVVGGLEFGTWSAVVLAEGLLAWAAFGSGRALMRGSRMTPSADDAASDAERPVADRVTAREVVR